MKRKVAIEVEAHKLFPGVYWAQLELEKKKLATLNFAPGHTVYGEKLVKIEGNEYRSWNPFRSKLAAAILNGLKKLPIKPGHKVLYLGAATGTTPSYISDIIEQKGRVFCIEFSPRVFRELIDRVCNYRQNMIPILDDARLPERYRMFIEEVDEIYCDIAQPEQAKILANNADMFLKSKGWVLLAIKARSINVAEEPTKIYEKELQTLRERSFDVDQVIQLEPYDKDHIMVLAKYTK